MSRPHEAGPAGEGAPCPRLLTVVALVAFAAGVAFRVDGAGRKSLWDDEYSTRTRISKPTIGAMITNLGTSPFPPLYYLSLRGWTHLWGTGDPALRSLSLLCGIATIPLTYVAWRTLMSRTAGMWAIALLSLNAYHCWYSQDAKMYAGIWLLSTLSSAAFLRIVLESGDSRRWRAVYVLSGACLPLMSYVGVAPLLAQGLFGVRLWLVRPRCRRGVAIASCLGLASLTPFLLWLPTALRVVGDRTGIRWIPPANASHAASDVYRLFECLLLGYETSGPDWPPGWASSLCYAHAPLAVLGLGLLGHALRTHLRTTPDRRASPDGPGQSSGAVGPRDRGREVVIYLAIWLLAPLLGLLLFSLSVYSLWHVPRYLSGVAPALVLWLAMSLGALPPRRLAFPLAASLIAGNLAALIFDRTHVTRVPLREISRSIIEATAAEGGRAAAGGVAAHRDVLHVVGQGEAFPLHRLTRELADRRAGQTFRLGSVAEAVVGRASFVVVNRYRGAGPPGAPLMTPESARDYTATLLSSIKVYEDALTGTPAPCSPFNLDVWLCRRRYPR